MAIVELHIPAARSLKEKRKVVKSLVERIAARYRISVAETAHHDLHQRAQIGLALVGSEPAETERHLDKIRRMIESNTDAFVADWQQDLLHGGDIGETGDIGEGPWS